MARIHDFADGDTLEAFDSSFWTSFLQRVLPRPASGTSWPSWPGDGGLHRVACLVGLERGDFQVLDTEADWRDRAIVAATLSYQPGTWLVSFTGPAFPGNPNDVLGVASLREGYTGAGRTQAQVSSGPSHGYVVEVTSDIHLFANSAQGGRLEVWRDGSDALTDPESLMLVILASEPTGRRSSPDASPSLAATDGQPIRPDQLNGAQDRSMTGQVRELSGAVDAFPLGSKLDAGGIPERFDLRRLSFGQADQPVRQPMAGMPWRFFYVRCESGEEVVVDESLDWRDRIVWGMGRHSTSSIGPGDPSEDLHAAATGWSEARYTGPGSSGALVDQGYGLRILGSASGIQLRARSSDGRLVLRNDSASTRYVTGIVAATFQLGPRRPA